MPFRLTFQLSSSAIPPHYPPSVSAGLPVLQFRHSCAPSGAPFLPPLHLFASPVPVVYYSAALLYTPACLFTIFAILARMSPYPTCLPTILSILSLYVSNLSPTYLTLGITQARGRYAYWYSIPRGIERDASPPLPPYIACLFRYFPYRICIYLPRPVSYLHKRPHYSTYTINIFATL